MMPSLSLLAIFAAVSVIAVSCTRNHTDINTKISQLEQSAIDAEAEKLFHQDDVNFSVAGENTPVWIAERLDISSPVVYRKQRAGIVKRAIQRWNRRKLKGRTIRSRRDSDTNMLTGNDAAEIIQDFSERINGHFEKIHNPTPINATSIVHRPLILVTMDFNNATWPTDVEDLNEFFMQRILYPLAFWHDVDIQLRHINGSKVRLQIAGIIISKNREATPYVYENTGFTGVNVDEAFTSMVSYWREPAKHNVNFPTSGYDIVATMTDLTETWWTLYQTQSKSTPGVSRCSGNLKDLGIMIISDDFAFKGIQLAVREMATILGPENNGTVPECPEIPGNVMSRIPGRRWSPCSVRRISKALEKNGQCFGKKIIEPPGKTVMNILPGNLVNASARCQAHGWRDGIVCSVDSTCGNICCSHDSSCSWCENIGPHVDGAECGTGKICLDGKCVTERIIF